MEKIASLFEYKVSREKAQLLRIIALGLMLVSHTIAIGFQEYYPLRIITHAGFPVFAFLAAQGYLHTSNLKKYVKRLFLLGAVSQIPFMLFSKEAYGGVYSPQMINILGSIALGIGLVYTMDKKKYLFFSFLVFLALVLDYEYWIFAPLIIVVFFLFEKQIISAKIFYLLFVIACVLFWLTGGPYKWAIAMAFGPLLIYLPPHQPYRIRLPRLFYYSFYPLHLLLLYLIFR